MISSGCSLPILAVFGYLASAIVILVALSRYGTVGLVPETEGGREATMAWLGRSLGPRRLFSVR